TFDIAESAQAALDSARAAASAERPFDVILLDLQGVDGLAFLRALRADPVLARTHCVALSALGDRLPEADELGVTAWLTKPVRGAPLLEVRTAIAGHTPASRAATPTQASIEPRFERARVLLVEDNHVNQLVAARMLKAFGIEAVVVADGVQAVAAVEKSAFDL